MGASYYTWAYPSADKKYLDFQNKYKLLIPEEFGGGYIEASFDGYWGNIQITNLTTGYGVSHTFENKPTTTYEILVAFMNQDFCMYNDHNEDITVGELLDENCRFNNWKSFAYFLVNLPDVKYGVFTNLVRDFPTILKLQYPLKLVPMDGTMTYEEVLVPSFPYSPWYDNRDCWGDTLPEETILGVYPIWDSDECDTYWQTVASNMMIRARRDYLHYDADIKRIADEVKATIRRLEYDIKVLQKAEKYKILKTNLINTPLPKSIHNVLDLTNISEGVLEDLVSRLESIIK